MIININANSHQNPVAVWNIIILMKHWFWGAVLVKISYDQSTLLHSTCMRTHKGAFFSLCTAYDALTYRKLWTGRWSVTSGVMPCSWPARWTTAHMPASWHALPTQRCEWTTPCRHCISWCLDVSLPLSLWVDQIFIIHQYTKHEMKIFSFDTWAQDSVLFFIVPVLEVFFCFFFLPL